MMTHYPPRVRNDAGTRPLFLGSVAHPHPTPLSLSLNIFLALCAPLSFTVSRRMSWFQGLMSEHLPRLPVQSTSHGEGKLVWVGHFPRRIGSCTLNKGGAVRSTADSFLLEVITMSDWGLLAYGTFCRMSSLFSMASRWYHVAERRSLLRISTHFRQNPNIPTWEKHSVYDNCFLLLMAFSKKKNPF